MQVLKTGPILFRFKGFLGVPVEVGTSLGLLVLLFAALGATAGRGILWPGISVALLVIAIYLHELGHAWASMAQGVPVRRIVLHGSGGFCQPERVATNAEQEFIVAMGPLTNLALWALSSLAAYAMWSLIVDGAGFAIYLAILFSLFARINLALFVFNLIPAHPLDGGRLVHLWLLRKMPPARALKVSGTIGLVAAIAWFPMLVWMYLTTGWLLLFAPSITLHYRMMKGGARG